MKPIMLQSMELDDSDKLEETFPAGDIKNVPDYPWGLRICLTQKELEKLQLDPEDAFVGGTIHGHFLAEITSASIEQRNGDQTCRIELQITNLAIESEDAEDEDAEIVQKPRKGIRSLYNGS